MNSQSYTALIQQRDEWWIGWIEEIPGVNCQEATKEELIETLTVSLKEILEINKQEAIQNANGSYQKVAIPI